MSSRWLAATVLAFVLGALGTYALLAVVPTAAPVAPAPAPIPPAFPASPGAQTDVESLADVRAIASDFEQTAALYNLLRRADRTRVDDLFAEAEALRPRREGLAAKAIIYARLAELDPIAAVERALDELPGPQRYLERVFSAWAKHDLEAALAHLPTLPPGRRASAAAGVLEVSEDLPPERRAALAGTFSLQRRLAELEVLEDVHEDLALAWQAASAEPALNTRMLKLHAIALEWVEADPPAALAAALTLPSGQSASDLLAQMIERWATMDSEAALAWVIRQPDSPAQAEALGAVASVLAAEDPRRALSIAEQFDGAARRRMLEATFQAWASVDAPAAMAALGRMEGPGLRMQTQFGIIHSWAEADPEAAFEWARAQKQTIENMHLAIIPLQAIARSDPEQALALAEALGGARFEQALSAITGAWAGEDPQAAAAWVAAAGPQARHAAAQVAYAYAQASPSEAIEWAERLPAEARLLALPSVVQAIAADSPAEASDFVAAISDPAMREEASRTLVTAWAQTEPDAANRWIARNASAQQRPQLYAQVFGMWGFLDRDGATTALRGLRRQEDRDHATMALMATSAYEDPDFAEELYRGIGDGEAKREAARMLFGRFSQTDPERAKRYQEAADLDGEHPGPSIFIAR